jgi:predicted nucleic acid-binding protein
MTWSSRQPLGQVATMIVTGDDDRLVLGNDSGIEIVTPRRFLERLDADS